MGVGGCREVGVTDGVGWDCPLRLRDNLLLPGPLMFGRPDESTVGGSGGMSGSSLGGSPNESRESDSIVKKNYPWVGVKWKRRGLRICGRRRIFRKKPELRRRLFRRRLHFS